MTSATAERRKMVAIRIRESDLAVIDQHARSHGLSRTDYMIRAALGEPLTSTGVEERLSALENRLGRMEELAYSG